MTNGAHVIIYSKDAEADGLSLKMLPVLILWTRRRGWSSMQK